MSSLWMLEEGVGYYRIERKEGKGRGEMGKGGKGKGRKGEREKGKGERGNPDYQARRLEMGQCAPILNHTPGSDKAHTDFLP